MSDLFSVKGFYPNFFLKIVLSYLHQYCCYLKQFSVFLFPGLCWFRHEQKFAKMARYDMTGIGINLREIPDESGMVRLKVLGLLLDGPAHSAGVRQVRSSIFAILAFPFGNFVNLHYIFNNDLYIR